MQVSPRALITAIHGLLFGGFFLLAVFGVVVELIRSAFASETSELTNSGRFLASLYLWMTAFLAWAAVALGTYFVYPLYRAVPPPGTTDLASFPQALLLASNTTSGWHRLAMEWKEHIAWLTPIAATMFAYVMTRQRLAMRAHAQVRKAVATFALVAFASAAIAAFFGAMINKHAPVDGKSQIQLLKER
ncbi:MAG TPA: hypothetical protein VJN93_06620 [Candidatus Acidoferrum sp.]|nr:hypothetical protein [Candidatus Acidoferrum sp.]